MREHGHPCGGESPADEPEADARSEEHAGPGAADDGAHGHREDVPWPDVPDDSHIQRSEPPGEDRAELTYEEDVARRRALREAEADTGSDTPAERDPDDGINLLTGPL